MTRIKQTPTPPSTPELDVRLPFERPVYDTLTSLYQRLVALIGLALLSPLLVLIALGVKLSSSGPVLYRGERVAKGKRRFTIYKFRTMKVGAEQLIGKRLVQPGEQTHYTVIGPLLRKYRLDELPQLLNVIKGEMALVGPRPLRPIFLDELCETIPRYERRFDVRPGITGLAQVRGGYYTSPRHKLAYDLLYIKRRSLALDLRLILLTFLRVMTRIISVSLATGWLLLASFALPEEQLSALTIQPKELSINLLYLALPLVVALKAVSATLARRRLSILKSPVDLIALCFLGVMTLSATLSVTPVLALRGALWYLCNALIPFYLCLNSAQLRREPLQTVRRFGLLGALIASFALIECLIQLTDGVWVRPGGGLDDPLWLSLGLSLLLPLAWCGARGPQGGDLQSLAPKALERELISEPVMRRLMSACVGLITLALLLAGSRVAWLTGSALALFTLPIKRGALIITVVLCTGLMMSGAGDDRFRPQALTDAVQGHLARQHRLLAEIPPTRLIFGVGPRVSPHYLMTREKQRLGASVTPREVREGPAPHEAPHLSGLILTSLVELGVIGSLLLLGVIGRSLLVIFREATRRSDSILQAVGVSISSALLIGLVCHPFTLFPLSLLFWSLLGFGLGVALEGRPGPKRLYQLIRASAPL